MAGLWEEEDGSRALVGLTPRLLYVESWVRMWTHDGLVASWAVVGVGRRRLGEVVGVAPFSLQALEAT